MIGSQRGQAGLVAILIALVLTVIGLSVASQASREALISTSESEGTRTLEGAQSGAEKGLQQEFTTSSSGDNIGSGQLYETGAAYEINAGTSLDLILEEGMSLELEGPFPSDITVQWGSAGQGNQAGLLVSYYKEEQAWYQGYNPYSGATGGLVGDFKPSDPPTGGYASKIDLPTRGADIIRIKALAATTVIKVDGVDPKNIRQVRAAAVNEQDNQGRVVEVRETAPGRPSVLDYALFAGSGAIEK